MQEVYIIDAESGQPEFCAPTASAALRALSITVTQLHAHMQSSQQQQRLPVVYAPVMSDLERLSDTLEGKLAASQAVEEEVARTDRDRSKLTGLVKALKSSFRRRASRDGSAQAEAMASEPPSPGLQQEASSAASITLQSDDGNRARREDVFRRCLAELQSTREGEQCLLKALLQQEGMRVLENCLEACLHIPKSPQQIF